MSESKIENEFNADGVNPEMQNDDTATEYTPDQLEDPTESIDNDTSVESSFLGSDESVEPLTPMEEKSSDSASPFYSDDTLHDGDNVNESFEASDSLDLTKNDTYEGVGCSSEDILSSESNSDLEYDTPMLENAPDGESNEEHKETLEDEIELDGENDSDDDNFVDSEIVDDGEDIFGAVFEEVKIDNCDIEEDEDEDEEEKKVGSRFVDSLFDFIELFIFSLAAVFIITTFFFRHSVVDGSSMERTLFDGEHIIISDLFYKPERGDIIVCEDYSTELPIPIVKRVIAIAGDRVEIDTEGNVKVNGELLDESGYVYIDPYYPYRCDEIALTVPEGEVFVMGDHRNVSSDSRKIGTIKEDSILGKVLFRFYPFDKFGAVE